MCKLDEGLVSRLAGSQAFANRRPVTSLPVFPDGIDRITDRTIELWFYYGEPCERKLTIRSSEEVDSMLYTV